MVAGLLIFSVPMWSTRGELLVIGGGSALLLVSLWWALGPSHLVMWYPWRGEPRLYVDHVHKDVAGLVRASVFAEHWERDGWAKFLWRMFRARSRWALYVDVCRDVAKIRRERGEYYDTTPGGAKVSVLLTEVAWLAETSTSVLLGRGVQDCHRALTGK